MKKLTMLIFTLLAATILTAQLPKPINTGNPAAFVVISDAEIYENETLVDAKGATRSNSCGVL